MPDSRALGVGFVGCGQISDLHALAYKGFNKAKIAATCDTNEAKARDKGKEWGATNYYTDYKKLLKDPKVDVVEILLPHYLHCEVAVATAEAGKHVSVQKPMAMNIKEADAMVSAARKAGVKFKVFENYVFYPPHVKAKELMDKKEIGTPSVVVMRLGNCGIGGWNIPGEVWAWRFNPKLCGGGPVVFDHGYHAYSLATYLLGDVDEVFAWINCTDVAGLKLDAPALVQWKYKTKGAYGTWITTWSPGCYVSSRFYGDDERLEITGEKGYIFVTRCTGQLLDQPPLILYKADGKAINYHNIECEWDASFRDSGRHFINCIIEDKQPLLSGEQGKKVLRMGLAALESARMGKPVKVDSIS
nr:Gfo/Idh/MocA family oxidoreductase [Candidatus Njordarchaeota archaeon]